MGKKAFLRGLLGFPLGIAIGQVITILISIGWGQGHYSPCVPELVETAGGELNAVVLQTVLCGLLGASFAAGSVIWEVDHWSIVKQTGVYFLVTALVMMPVAYLNRWMKRSVTGALGYFAVFLVIFAAVWLVQYRVWKSKVRKLNERLK